MAENKTLTKAQQKEIDKELPYALGILGELEDFQIQNDEDQEFIAEGLREIKSRVKALEEKRKRITVPLNEAVKEVNNLFRPPREALEGCEKLLKLKISDYQIMLDERSQAAVLAAAEAETSEEASEALEGVATVESPKGVSVRYVWKAEVFRPELVPYEFLSPDLDKIDVHIKQSAGQEPPAIPGVRYIKHPVVTSRSK